MTEYKKEPPNFHPHHGKTHSKEKIPMTIEHELAEIIMYAQEDLKKEEKSWDSYHTLSSSSEEIIDAARRAWDLVPEENRKIPCYNCDGLVFCDWKSCPFCAAPMEFLNENPNSL